MIPQYNKLLKYNIVLWIHEICRSVLLQKLVVAQLLKKFPHLLCQPNYGCRYEDIFLDRTTCSLVEVYRRFGVRIYCIMGAVYTTILLKNKIDTNVRTFVLF
jgi:hypothetical protein